MWYYTVEKARISKLDFYRLSPEYCFASARFQAATRERRLHFIHNAVGKKVLDYGGGSGDLTLMLAKRDFEVYYVDIDGISSDLAYFRFKKSKFKKNIKFLPFYGDLVLHFEVLPVFDDIFCIDVIEHLDLTEQLDLLKCFKEHLRQKGRLFLTGPKTGDIRGLLKFPKKSRQKVSIQGHPEHRGISFDINKYLHSQGFNRLGKSIWEKI